MYQGLACAVYGNAQGKFTLTELAGTKKNDIRVVNSETREFYPHSPSKKFIEGAFGNLINTARSIADKVQGTTLPLVIGTESDFNVSGILTALSGTYPGTILKDSSNGKAHEGGYTLKVLASAFERMPKDLLWGLFGDSFYSVIAEGVKDKSNIYIARHRGFDCVRKQAAACASGSTKLVSAQELIPLEFRSSLEHLLNRWESGESSVQQELLDKARELGDISSGIYLLRQELTGATYMGPRFFDAPDDLRSRLYIVPGARETFGARFTELLGIPHNICVKGNRDKSSPPYGDVTAAIMADYMDKETGEKPGVVLVNHKHA